MLKLLATFLVIINFAKSVDHNIYRSCNQVDACKYLRNYEILNDYGVVGGKVTYDFDQFTFTLRSFLNGNLDVVISGLDEDTFRIQISEANSTRYKLKDVLVEEPKLKRFDDFDIVDEAFTITSGSNVVKVYMILPFYIVFSKNDIPMVVFDGNRLYMSHKNEDGLANFAFAVNFPQATQLYGLHQHSDTLALKNTIGKTDPYRLKNLDTTNFDPESPMALYGSVPTLYGHGVNGTAGVFLHNAAEQWVETTNRAEGSSEAYFMVDSGSLDLFIMLGPTVTDVVRQYTALTGTTPLPPLWSLGYHQCRQWYDNQTDVENVIQSFDDNNIQMDTIWLDLEYMDGKRYFTWDYTTFSDPLGLQEKIGNSNKKLIVIIDPHIKKEKGYSVYDQGLEKDLFVKNPDGTNYENICWPGTSTWMDFLNPEAREFYGDMYSYDNFPNTTSVIAGIWNDMNEPSVFDILTELTFPSDLLHFGNVRNREMHNIYGLLHTLSTYEGLIKRDNGELRPFILTRSHFAGSQRYAAFWTGDTQADWPYLKASFQECLSGNLLGLVFCGSDIGGFYQDPTTELLERWYQAAAWVPFFRGHSASDTTRREPYLLEKDSQDIIRNTIQNRYKHLPVWYTLFYEHLTTGDPIIRPLFYQYPQDTNTFTIDDELLVGSNILVQAVTQPGVQSVDMYFPGGEKEVWISANSDDVQVGNGIAKVDAPREYIPVYYRKGAVIARKDTLRLNTVEMANDTYTLYYTLDDNNEAHGEVYIDDGITFKYKDSVDFSFYSIDIQGDDVSIEQVYGNGSYPLVLDKLVRRDVIKMPENRLPGQYKETIFTTDVNGMLLKESTGASYRQIVLKV